MGEIVVVGSQQMRNYPKQHDAIREEWNDRSHLGLRQVLELAGVRRIQQQVYRPCVGVHGGFHSDQPWRTRCQRNGKRVETHFGGARWSNLVKIRCVWARLSTCEEHGKQAKHDDNDDIPFAIGGH